MVQGRARLVAFAVATSVGWAGSAVADDAVRLAGTRWTVVGRVPTASMPWSVTPSPDGRWLYVAHVGVGKRHRDNVWRYSAGSLDVLARSRFRGHAVEAVLSRDGGRLFVTNSRMHELLELDPMSLEVRARWTPGRVPKDLRLLPGERQAAVANWGSHDLSIVDLDRPGAEPARIRTGRHTRGVEVSRDGRAAFAMAFSADAVVAVSLPDRRVAEPRLARCNRPRHAVASGDRLLVTCNGDGLVLVLDIRPGPGFGRVERRIRVGAGPKTIALSPDGRLAVVANEGGNSLSAIDLETWRASTARVPGRKPCGVAFAPDGGRLYVTLRGSHQLLVLEREIPARLD